MEVVVLLLLEVPAIEVDAVVLLMAVELLDVIDILGIPVLGFFNLEEGIEICPEELRLDIITIMRDVFTIDYAQKLVPRI